MPQNTVKNPSHFGRALNSTLAHGRGQELADAIGIQSGRISKWRKGNIRHPETEVLREIIAAIPSAEDRMTLMRARIRDEFPEADADRILYGEAVVREDGLDPKVERAFRRIRELVAEKPSRGVAVISVAASLGA